MPRPDDATFEATEPDSNRPAIPAIWTIDGSTSGRRLDRFLSEQFSELSRALLQRAIAAGKVLVNDRPAKASQKLHAGDRVVVQQLEIPRQGPEPQPMVLDILYEDDCLAVINKPAGMVVHPARGHWDGTLASGLAHHFDSLSRRGGPARPGIVHRLDRDTSGVIVVAKHDAAHDALASQFQRRSVEKQYLAITCGRPDRDQDVVDEPIGDHPGQREKKAIRRGHASSREAVTFYEVSERFDRFALIRARPKTGRTHQIRLHLAHVGCPVLCDRLYGGRASITAGEVDAQSVAPHRVLLQRQALHAVQLTIAHPTSGMPMQFEAALPEDMQAVLTPLRQSG